MNNHINSSNFQAPGIPANNQGAILQRGGEELILEKVDDRFTVRPTTPVPPRELSQAFLADWRRSIPKAKLEVFTVPPSELEMAMTEARASQDVAFASHVYQIKNSPGTFIYLTDQITIQFAPEVGAANINAIATEFGLELLKSVEGIPNTLVFTVGKQATENPIKIANKLMGRTEILTAEANIVVPQEPHYQPRDTLYPQQWYLNHKGGIQLATGSHIGVEKAWDITRGVRSVVVAVMDDSFDLNHPDFQGSGKVIAPKDFKDQDFLPLPYENETSHGTACAGIAVAEENGSGIVGVAPGCALMPLRTTGYLDDQSIEELFDWAIKQGASVISCSWGPAAVYFPLSLRQRAAITRAATSGRKGKGCVIVFAAGNANRPTKGTVNEQGWPNNILQGPTEWLGGFTVHPDVIAIAASSSLNKKAAYSNWGPNISVCAPSNNAPPGTWLQQTGFIPTPPAVNTALPGLGMFTTDQLGAAGYDSSNFTSEFGGTSSACPVVAGVAALVLSANPDLTAQQVRRILQETADKIVDPNPDPQLGLRYGTYDANGFSQWFGYGKVNAFKAVQAAQQQRTTPSNGTKQVVGRNDGKMAIPDGDRRGIKSAIAISDSSPVREILVTVEIAHEFLGDLEIYLISPNGQQVLLQNRTLGRRTQLQTTYKVRWGEMLNQPANGRWHLWVVDYASQDTGMLNRWELTLGI